MKVRCRVCIFVMSFLVASCSSTDENLDYFFYGLVAGNNNIEFPYKLSDSDTVCALQAYQGRIKSSSGVPGVEIINGQLDKEGFRGGESAWVLIRFSGGEVIVHKIDRYKVSLSSPQDSDHKEWEAEAGKKSVECATGSQMKFDTFINKKTGERRVGIASVSGD